MFKHLKEDLPAGIVVLFVAVPLCLGIALASGAPLLSGLIAGIVGGLIVGALSGSQLGVSGPAAGLAVIVLGAINELQSFPAFLLAVVLAGVFQILLGMARAGTIAYFFPSAVIKGMLAGIGVVIVLKQIPHALGHDSDPDGELAYTQPDGDTTLSALERMLGDLDMGAIIVSAISLTLLILWDKVLSKKGKIFRLIQGPLVVVAFGIVYQIVTAALIPSISLADTHRVAVPVFASIAEARDALVFPDFGRIGDKAIWILAATMAVVASLETLLCVEATDKIDPEKRVTPTNRELFAQGVGNISSGLIGGLPVTQVIVRSSANVHSGGRTKLSTMIHGFFLMVFVLLLPEVLNLVPLAVLASILLVVGYKLANPKALIGLWKTGHSQFWPYLITVGGIVFTDLLVGIGLGMAVSISFILKRSYDNSHFLHMKEKDEHGVHIVKFRLAEEVTFLNRGAIVNALSHVPDGSHVTIDASESSYIDNDVLEVIEDFVETAPNHEIEVEVLWDRKTLEKKNGSSALAAAS